jgi:NADPH:quinone reductase-like Zn-dependent oxidoreductase
VGSRQDQLDMIRTLELGGLKPVIDARYPLEGIAEAFHRLESRRHFGKICLEM